MNEIFVFNHHSLPFETSQAANESIPEFIKICHSARNSIGLKTILVDETIDNSWFRIELSKGYYWQDWFNLNKKEDSVLKEEIQAFRSIATQSPLFKKEDIGGDLEHFDTREKITNEYLTAIKAAAWYKTPLCSFPTQAPWDSNPLEICIETLDDEGSLVEKDDTLLNIYNLSVWNTVKQDLINIRNENLKNGKQLWAQRKTLFPHLIFCGNTSSQFQRWSYGTGIYSQAREALTCLNNYAEGMKTGAIKGYSHDSLRDSGLSFKVTGESKTVKQDPRLRKEREFNLPSNGEKKFFENHVKLSSGFRIHFFPEPSGGIIYIGHVGPHLKEK
ncbi:MAG: hypothetical protein GY754_41035 [bacterium]|nr:hypothetical protein [bacterium]